MAKEAGLTFKKFVYNAASETISFEAELSGSISRDANAEKKWSAWSIENAETTLKGVNVPLREIAGVAIKRFYWVRNIQQIVKSRDIDGAKAMLKDGFTWGLRPSVATVQLSLQQMLERAKAAAAKGEKLDAETKALMLELLAAEAEAEAEEAAEVEEAAEAE